MKKKRVKNKREEREKGRRAAEALRTLEMAQNAYVVAGAEILEKQFGFTEKQRQDWAAQTLYLAQKYMQMQLNVQKGAVHDGSKSDGKPTTEK